ncbi:MAG: biotin--[acetyl-CoA-carboxylase] ligase [bacterium]
MISERTLSDGPIGSVWINFKEIDSTNEKAHALAFQGVQEGTVVTADRQTKGRGRRGRHWYSPEGGLYCSIILRPDISPDETVMFERMAGIALWETINHFVPEKARVKVPNDILIKGKKVAGILIEAKWRKGKLHHLITGVGINCTGDLDSLPKELNARITNISNEKGRLVLPSETLNILIQFMNKWYSILMSGDIDAIYRRWKALVEEGMACPNCY